MSEEKPTLTERLVDHMSRNQGGFFARNNHMLTQDEFNKKLDIYVLDMIGHYEQQRKQNPAFPSALGNREELHDHLREHFEKTQKDRSQGAISRSHSLYLDKWENIVDGDKRAVWADFHQQGRLLMFRFISALSIAAVILFTYWLGDLWGIQLPLRMPPL